MLKDWGVVIYFLCTGVLSLFLGGILLGFEYWYVFLLLSVVSVGVYVAGLLLRGTSKQSVVHDPHGHDTADLSHYRSIIQNIRTGMMITGVDGDIVVMNESAKVIFGVDTVSAIWEQFELFAADMVTPLSREQMPFNQLKLYSQLLDVFIRPKNTLKGGMLLRLNTTAICTVDEVVCGGLTTIEDITKAAQIDRAKTEFVSLASHQLRTPLTVVGWYAEMLMNSAYGELNSQQKEFIEEIYHGNQRMLELVNALLNVTQIELGIFKVNPSRVNLGDIAQSVLEELKLLIQGKGMEVSLRIDGLVPVMTDASLIRIVYQNLLTNAVRYSHVKGSLVIDHAVLEAGTHIEGKRHVDEKSVLISISDTGMGIPPNQQSKIFSRLFRADNVKQKDTSGSGLGLYVCKSIIEHFGGQIWFVSELHKGTTFYILLPVDIHSAVGESFQPIPMGQ